MNLGNSLGNSYSLGMAAVINSPAAPGAESRTGGTRGASGSAGESPFQKLMSLMMASGNGNGTEAAAVSGQEPGAINQLLAGLLPGGGQINPGLWNAFMAVEEGTGKADAAPEADPESAELMTDSLSSLLAMFDGQIGAYLVGGKDGASEGGKSPLDAEALKALIGGTADSVRLIAQITGSDGTSCVVAEINGKQVEFTGVLKDSAAAATLAANPQELPQGSAEMAKGLTPMELLAILEGRQEEPENPGAMLKALAEQAKAASQRGLPAEPQAMTGQAEGTGTQVGSIEESLQYAGYHGQPQSAGTVESPGIGQSSQSTGGPEAYGQIGKEILAKLEQKGPTEFKMQLSPEHLGEIDVSLKLSEGKLIIDILAANAKTQALLTGQVDKLIASMGLQNVQVESVHVSQQMNSQTQDNGQNQSYFMNSSMDFSQRRQQEQLGQEPGRNGTTGSGRPEEGQFDGTVSQIGPMGYNFHRMNYAV